MSIDWSKILTPAAIEHQRRTAAEINRLYALPDRWLAEALVRLVREVRQAFPAKLGNPHAGTYEPTFCWHVVPEVARRLGGVRLLPNEATAPDVTTLGDVDLRKCVGTSLNNLALDRWPGSRGVDAPTAAEILAHGIANGNPVAFAVDRLHPAPEPDDDRDDWIARHVREISGNRGFEPTPYWSPALQQWGRRSGNGDTMAADREPDTGEDNVIALVRPGLR